jgi:hypothetical protein
VLPVWARQLASSRSQSETAVAEMLGAFAEIGPHLNMATRQSGQITSSAGTRQRRHHRPGARPVRTSSVRWCRRLDAPTAAAIERVMQLINAAPSTHWSAISKPFERETQLVGQQVERMYRGFQYQDRISQMMSAACIEDIERLRKRA